MQKLYNTRPAARLAPGPKRDEYLAELLVCFLNKMNMMNYYLLFNRCETFFTIIECSQEPVLLSLMPPAFSFI
jgi:hypothetical protein